MMLGNDSKGNHSGGGGGGSDIFDWMTTNSADLHASGNSSKQKNLPVSTLAEYCHSNDSDLGVDQHTESGICELSSNLDDTVSCIAISPRPSSQEKEVLSLWESDPSRSSLSTSASFLSGVCLPDSESINCARTSSPNIASEATTSFRLGGREEGESRVICSLGPCSSGSQSCDADIKGFCSDETESIVSCSVSLNVEKAIDREGGEECGSDGRGDEKEGGETPKSMSTSISSHMNGRVDSVCGFFTSWSSTPSLSSGTPSAVSSGSIPLPQSPSFPLTGLEESNRMMIPNDMPQTASDCGGAHDTNSSTNDDALVKAQSDSGSSGNNIPVSNEIYDGLCSESVIISGSSRSSSGSCDTADDDFGCSSGEAEVAKDRIIGDIMSLATSMTTNEEGGFSINDRKGDVGISGDDRNRIDCSSRCNTDFGGSSISASDSDCKSSVGVSGDCGNRNTVRNVCNSHGLEEDGVSDVEMVNGVSSDLSALEGLSRRCDVETGGSCPLDEKVGFGRENEKRDLNGSEMVEDGVSGIVNHSTVPKSSLFLSTASPSTTLSVANGESNIATRSSVSVTEEADDGVISGVDLNNCGTRINHSVNGGIVTTTINGEGGRVDATSSLNESLSPPALSVYASDGNFATRMFEQRDESADHCLGRAGVTDFPVGGTRAFPPIGDNVAFDEICHQQNNHQSDGQGSINHNDSNDHLCGTNKSLVNVQLGNEPNGVMMTGKRAMESRVDGCDIDSSSVGGGGNGHGDGEGLKGAESKQQVCSDKGEGNCDLNLHMREDVQLNHPGPSTSDEISSSNNSTSILSNCSNMKDHHHHGIDSGSCVDDIGVSNDADDLGSESSQLHQIQQLSPTSLPTPSIASQAPSSSLSLSPLMTIPTAVGDTDGRELLEHLDTMRSGVAKDVYKRERQRVAEELIEKADSYPKVSGIYFDKHQLRWSVGWAQNGRRVAKYFPVKTFGLNAGYHLAVRCKQDRRAPDEDGGIVGSLGSGSMDVSSSSLGISPISSGLTSSTVLPSSPSTVSSHQNGSSSGLSSLSSGGPSVFSPGSPSDSSRGCVSSTVSSGCNASDPCNAALLSSTHVTSPSHSAFSGPPKRAASSSAAESHPLQQQQEQMLLHQHRIAIQHANHQAAATAAANAASAFDEQPYFLCPNSSSPSLTTQSPLHITGTASPSPLMQSSSPSCAVSLAASPSAGYSTNGSINNSSMRGLFLGKGEELSPIVPTTTSASTPTPSSTTGVHYDRQSQRWKASWCDATGQRKAKYFSALKLGYERAHRMAVIMRENHHVPRKSRIHSDMGACMVAKSGAARAANGTGNSIATYTGTVSDGVSDVFVVTTNGDGNERIIDGIKCSMVDDQDGRMMLVKGGKAGGALELNITSYVGDDGVEGISTGPATSKAASPLMSTKNELGDDSVSGGRNKGGIAISDADAGDVDVSDVADCEGNVGISGIDDEEDDQSLGGGGSEGGDLVLLGDDDGTGGRHGEGNINDEFGVGRRKRKVVDGDDGEAEEDDGEEERPLDPERDKELAQEPARVLIREAAKLRRITGTWFDKKQLRWACTFNDRSTGKRRAEYFPVKDHGFFRARQLAVAARRRMDRINGLKGVKRSSSPGLSPSNLHNSHGCGNAVDPSLSSSNPCLLRHHRRPLVDGELDGVDDLIHSGSIGGSSGDCSGDDQHTHARIGSGTLKGKRLRMHAQELPSSCHHLSPQPLHSDYSESHGGGAAGGLSDGGEDATPEAVASIEECSSQLTIHQLLSLQKETVRIILGDLRNVCLLNLAPCVVPGVFQRHYCKLQEHLDRVELVGGQSDELKPYLCLFADCIKAKKMPSQLALSDQMQLLVVLSSLADQLTSTPSD